MYPFFALISRMKYIDRWELMRNSRNENLSDHCLEVGIIAHALCIISNKRFKRNLNAEKAALIGMYHDASEIITGDMPTPVKYYGKEITTAYKKIEKIAEKRLVDKLPKDFKEEYEKIFFSDETEDDIYIRKLVKAADKISAYIKCIEEKKAGNSEFKNAEESTKHILDEMAKEIPEIDIFMKEFLDDYGKTLDELLYE